MLSRGWRNTRNEQRRFAINPLHLKISMHILHTVLYTFPEALTRRIYQKIKSSLSW